jgi:hypothetical protein
MLAAWLSGLGGMQGGVGVGGGGVLGTLGSIFLGTGGGGIFGGVGPGGTASTFPSSSQLALAESAALAGALPGLGGSTIGGLVTGPARSGGGGLTAGALTGGLGGLAGLLGLGGVTAGLGLFGRGISGSPVAGALGGALLGVGGAVGIGALLGAPIAIGLAAGIIPGIILAGIGALFGFLGRGKKKEQATAIAQQAQKAYKEIIQQFEDYQVDYESALGGVESVWQQAVSGWNQIGGKVARRSIDSQRHWYTEALDEINRIEKVREQRLGVIGGLPIPEFALGGLVSDQLRAIRSGQGRLLAYLHQGEAVLNARAVQALGRGFIEQANRAPSLQGGGIVGAQAGAAGRREVNIRFGDVHFHNVWDGNEAYRQFRRRLERALAGQGLSLGS